MNLGPFDVSQHGELVFSPQMVDCQEPMDELGSILCNEITLRSGVEPESIGIAIRALAKYRQPLTLFMSARWDGDGGTHVAEVEFVFAKGKNGTSYLGCADELETSESSGTTFKKGYVVKYDTERFLSELHVSAIKLHAQDN